MAEVPEVPEVQFTDFSYALKFRDVVKQIVGDEVDKTRPRYQYAAVTAINRVTSKCTVLYIGDSTPVTVSMGSTQPNSTGQIVRVAGLTGDKYIDDILGVSFVGSVQPLVHAATHLAGGSDALPVDAATGVGSLRTLGTSALAAAAGNDIRFSDTRTTTVTSITAGTDLNTLTATGVYLQTGDVNATLALNYPVANICGRLEVTAGYTYQRFTTYRSGGDRVFVRGWYGSVWSSWTELTKTNDARLSDARTPVAHNQTAATITDFNTVADARVVAGITGKANTAHAHAPTDVTGTAVIITDARLSDARTPVAHNQTAATITDFNTAADARVVAGITLKAPLNSPAFTGTPTGITKTHVGLGNVDNTTDVAKPVSTLQAAADGLRLFANDPSVTNARVPTGSAGGDLVGSYPNPTFRAGLGSYAAVITDWNLAVVNGWFMGTNILNQPVPGATYYIGNVVSSSSSYCTQTVYEYTTDGSSDCKTYSRSMDNSVWTAWYKLSLSVAERDTAITSAIDALTITLTGSINNKSKNVYSTLPATGTAYLDGDLWFQKNGANVIIAQWVFAVGFWVPVTVSDSVIGNLDVGKLTGGFINAGHIDASLLVIGGNQVSSGTIPLTTTIQGGSIKTGTIDASLATITNINASNISTGTIAAGRIDAATLTGQTITGGTITGGTITGTNIKTAQAGSPQIVVGPIASFQGIHPSIAWDTAGDGVTWLDPYITHKSTTKQLICMGPIGAGSTRSGLLLHTDYSMLISYDSIGAVGASITTNGPAKTISIEGSNGVSIIGTTFISTLSLTNPLTQAKTHSLPDTDASAASLHHTIGAGTYQVVAGNDTRLTAGLAGTATVRAIGATSTTVVAGNDTRLTVGVAGTATVRAIGATSTTAAAGDHTHAVVVEVPVGTISMFGGTVAPSGWFSCNGSGVSTTGITSELFAVIGYTYGGSGATFYLPNFTNAFPRGNAAGGSGGAATVTLTAAQSGLQEHTHVIGGSTGGTASNTNDHFARSSNAADNNFRSGGTASSSVYGSGGLANAGASQSHENLPPYIGVMFIIKY